MTRAYGEADARLRLRERGSPAAPGRDSKALSVGVCSMDM
jgi:hypothetical protein